MLEHLEIRNFALIENLSIDFDPAFNVITGETGSGKSIILGALGLLMGEKADSSSIRTGADEIVVNAVVSVPENHEIIPYLHSLGIEIEDGRIIVRRTVRSNGRSVISVQGSVISRSELTEIADSLIDMHGQSEHQSLLISDKQRKIIDFYSHNEGLLESCRELSRAISDLKKEREELEESIEEGKRTSDYLRFACDEINSAEIKPDEDELLKERIAVIGNYEAIYENLSSASDKLKELNSCSYDAQLFCNKAAKSDPNLGEFCSRLESSRIETEDILNSIKSYLGNVDFSEEAVNQMQDRLALLQRLKRKYGKTLQEVIDFGHDAQIKLDAVDNSENLLEKLNGKIQKAFEQYKVVASELSKKRSTSAKELEGKIEDTLKGLGMPNASFSIKVVADNDKVNANGFDSVSFFISANPGENEKEMKDIASGGELSRVMLALKTVLAKSDSIQTQIFDEIDSGIGGSVALSLSECICDLAKTKQVIAITHLASIASKADCQFVVSKTVENGRTYTHLKQSQDEDRVREIARMLSGEESDVSLEHARKILGY